MFTPMSFSFPIVIVSLLESNTGSQIAIGFKNEENSLFVDLTKVIWEKVKNFSSTREAEKFFNDIVKTMKKNQYLVTNKEGILKLFD